MTRFQVLSDIANLFDSGAALARALDQNVDTMRKYLHGERPFPAQLIDPLVEAARRREGGEDVTHALVCALIDRARKRAAKRKGKAAA
jgi:hypothetical protein